MNHENIEKASNILSNIKTLEAEKTYKNFWCSADLDSIHSCIVINERESMAVVEVKKKEIEELNKQIDELLRGGEDE